MPGVRPRIHSGVDPLRLDGPPGAFSRVVDTFQPFRYAPAVDANAHRRVGKQGGLCDATGCSVMESSRPIRPGTVGALLGLALVFILGAPVQALEGAADLEAGFMAYQRGDYDQAIQSYSKVLSTVKLTRSDTAILFYLRGEAADRKGDPDQAIHDYSQTIKLDPNYTAAFYARGLAFEKKGLLTEAYEDLRKAAELEPARDRYRRKLIEIAAKVQASRSSSGR